MTLIDINGIYKPALRHSMLDKIDQTLRFHQTALSLRGYRQEVLSANIANADTPYYKARDLDFSSALKTALGPATAPVPTTGLIRTSTLHLAGTPTAAAGQTRLMYRVPYQPSVDGNTVNMDVERAAFAENALRLEAVLTFMRGDFKDLQLAMSQ